MYCGRFALRRVSHKFCPSVWFPYCDISLSSHLTCLPIQTSHPRCQTELHKSSCILFSLNQGETIYFQIRPSPCHLQETYGAVKCTRSLTLSYGGLASLCFACFPRAVWPYRWCHNATWSHQDFLQVRLRSTAPRFSFSWGSSELSGTSARTILASATYSISLVIQIGHSII